VGLSNASSIFGWALIRVQDNKKSIKANKSSCRYLKKITSAICGPIIMPIGNLEKKMRKNLLNFL
jgi:hypothetical protein